MPAQPKVPSVPRRQLARILSKLHEESGLFIKDVAEQVDLHHKTVIKMLKGQPCNLKQIYIDKLCEIYDVSPETKKTLKALALEAETARDWWYEFNDVLAEVFSAYLTLEGYATGITIYQNARVPGLVQTAAYARAMMQAGPWDLADDELERLVAVRLRRQSLLTAEYAPTVNIILDESVIHRPIGNDPKVTAEQLRHISDVSKLSNVSIRIVPLHAGIYRGINTGSFILLDFDESDELPEPPIVYIEGTPSSALYLEKPEQVEQYRSYHAEMERLALSATKSRALLSQIAKELLE